MRLLFDQNISPELVRRLADVFPDSTHVFVLGLDQAEDFAIAEYALAKDFVIITKDADFSEMLFLENIQQRIVWIRRGNCSTDAGEDLLRNHAKQINSLRENENLRLLMLF